MRHNYNVTWISMNVLHHSSLLFLMSAAPTAGDSLRKMMQRGAFSVWLQHMFDE